MVHELHRRYFGGHLLMEEEETSLLCTFCLNSDVDFDQYLWFQFYNHCFLGSHGHRLYSLPLGKFTSSSQQVFK